MAAAGTLLLLALLAHTVWVALGFVLHAYDRMVTGAALPRLRDYAKAFGGEWWWELVATLSAPLALLHGLVFPPLRPLEGPAVVLVHGYLRNPMVMWLMAWRLRRRGFPYVTALSLGRTLDPIEEQSGRLLARLRVVGETAGSFPILAVGHSLGGVVLRHALAREDAPPCDLLVTLGTPHRGTRLAHFAPGTSAAQLRPSSTFLRALPMPPSQVVAIASDLDNVVLPAESALLEPDEGPTHRCGHLSLCYDGAVFTEVSALLEEAAARLVRDERGGHGTRAPARGAVRQKKRPRRGAPPPPG